MGLRGQQIISIGCGTCKLVVSILKCGIKCIFINKIKAIWMWYISNVQF